MFELNVKTVDRLPPSRTGDIHWETPRPQVQRDSATLEPSDTEPVPDHEVDLDLLALSHGVLSRGQMCVVREGGHPSARLVGIEEGKAGWWMGTLSGYRRAGYSWTGLVSNLSDVHRAAPMNDSPRVSGVARCIHFDSNSASGVHFQAARSGVTEVRCVSRRVVRRPKLLGPVPSASSWSPHSHWS